MTEGEELHRARLLLGNWASQHSNVTPLDGTDRDSPTFGDLRAVLKALAAKERTASSPHTPR